MNWQDGAVLVLAAAGLWCAVWLRRRCGRGHDCGRCAARRENALPPPDRRG